MIFSSFFLTGNQIKLSHSEVDIVVDFINEMAHCGFPLSHVQLKEHVDDICSVHLGASFPTKGVGENWTYRFLKSILNGSRLHVPNH